MTTEEISKEENDDEKSSEALTPALSQGEREIEESGILNDDEQTLFIAGLSRGGSPQSVCQDLLYPLDVFQRTLDCDPMFRARRDQIEEMLCQNVAAALYKAAMEGNVSAQTHWLRNHPPEHWREDKNELPEKFHNLENLSDDDIKRLANFIGEKIPQELAG